MSLHTAPKEVPGISRNYRTKYNTRARLEKRLKEVSSQLRAIETRLQSTTDTASRAELESEAAEIRVELKYLNDYLRTKQ